MWIAGLLSIYSFIVFSYVHPILVGYIILAVGYMLCFIYQSNLFIQYPPCEWFVYIRC
jgi:hypothetical protein